MEVPATGTGASGLERTLPNPLALPRALPAQSAPSGLISADSIAALLGELKQADLTRLLQIVEAPIRSLNTARAEVLLHAASEALAAQDRGRAFDFLQQFVSADPSRAESLASSPELATFRPQVEQLLAQLTNDAKLHAEHSLAEATRKLETSSAGDKGVIRPELFVTVAGKYLEAGGLVNYVRSTAVSTAFLDPTHWAPAPVVEPAIAQQVTSWQGSLSLLLSLWIALGIVAIALCWWLRSDSILIACGAWAGGLGLLTLIRSMRRWPPS